MSEVKTILIVDDDAVLADLYRVKFERAGYAVVTCRNGREAFDTLAGGLKPIVIILDLIMPEVDGLTFLQEASYKLRLPPVIVMTSEESDVAKLEVHMRGAHAYLIKAKVSPADVLEQIKYMLKRQAK